MIIELELEGTLQSFRDAEFNSRSAVLNNINIRKAAASWYVKMLATGKLPVLRDMAWAAWRSGYMVWLLPEIYRHRQIRDFKNAVTGFDHMILDPLVSERIFVSDSTQALHWERTILSKTAKGDDYVKITFGPSLLRCSKWIQQKALKESMNKINPKQEK